MSDYVQLIVESTTDPKGEFVFDLAIGNGRWDEPIECSPCDLGWSPGWMLRDGWPTQVWRIVKA